MTESYAKTVAAASAIAQDFIMTTLDDSADGVRDVDQVLQGLLRRVGLDACANITGRVAKEVSEKAKVPGMGIQRRPTVTYGCVFGSFTVDSPYLYDRRTGQSFRPVQEVLGIRNGGRSTALERALTDFGAEDSYGQGADRFEEHYGWHVDRGCVRHVTRKVADEVEKWVTTRLESGEDAFMESLATRPGVDRVLGEQDGSMVRTGTLSAAPGKETTATRRLPRRRRERQWREVRVGVTRELDGTEKTYVAAMDGYPTVTRSLFQAAVGHGLSSRSETICVGDGANGLREEMLSQFPNASYILDRYHLLEHMYETAEEIGLAEDDRRTWVESWMVRIDRGEARAVVVELRATRGRGQKRVRRLAGYLERFRDCVHYDAYRERGVPIGSGEVESAHRSIPQKRMKLPGACWHPDSVNPMLALRVLRANKWWREFWKQKNAA